MFEDSSDEDYDLHESTKPKKKAAKKPPPKRFTNSINAGMGQGNVENLAGSKKTKRADTDDEGLPPDEKQPSAGKYPKTATGEANRMKVPETGADAATPSDSIHPLTTTTTTTKTVVNGDAEVVEESEVEFEDESDDETPRKVTEKRLDRAFSILQTWPDVAKNAVLAYKGPIDLINVDDSQYDPDQKTIFIGGKKGDTDLQTTILFEICHTMHGLQHTAAANLKCGQLGAVAPSYAAIFRLAQEYERDEFISLKHFYDIVYDASFDAAFEADALQAIRDRLGNCIDPTDGKLSYAMYVQHCLTTNHTRDMAVNVVVPLLFKGKAAYRSHEVITAIRSLKVNPREGGAELGLPADPVEPQ